MKHSGARLYVKNGAPHLIVSSISGEVARTTLRRWVRIGLENGAARPMYLSIRSSFVPIRSLLAQRSGA